MSVRCKSVCCDFFLLWFCRSRNRIAARAVDLFLVAVLSSERSLCRKSFAFGGFFIRSRGQETQPLFLSGVQLQNILFLFLRLWDALEEDFSSDRSRVVRLVAGSWLRLADRGSGTLDRLMWCHLFVLKCEVGLNITHSNRRMN